MAGTGKWNYQTCTADCLGFPSLVHCTSRTANLCQRMEFPAVVQQIWDDPQVCASLMVH